jgi:hypothetical protein
MTEQYLDGNALAGPLSEIFAVDITAAAGRCANCGRTGPVAALRLYVRAPGLVARCPGCDAVMLRLVRVPARKGTSSGGTEGGGTDRAGTEGAGTDRAGTDRAGTDRAGTDRAGTDRAGTEGAGTETAWLDLRGVACLQIPIPPT